MAAPTKWLSVVLIALVSYVEWTSGQSRCAEKVNSVSDVEACRTQDGMEEWAYVNVRTGVRMFYWLYRTTHKDGWKNRPWIIWLQGGPGGSGVGYGNFEIIGPRDLNLQPRETTWVQDATVVFIDNPVGAGYSYVDDVNDPTLLTRTTEQVTDDMMVVVRKILEMNPELQALPLYVFGQSYGGKMGSHFTKHLYEEQLKGNVQVNTTAFAMGNSWISPIDSTTTWAGLLFWMNIIDEVGYSAIMAKATECSIAVDNEQWEEATQLWRETEYVLWDHANYVDFYNILNYNVMSNDELSASFQKKLRDGTNKMDERTYRFVMQPMAAPSLDSVMNGEVREELEIIPATHTWGSQSDACFQAQEGDFMKPVINVVEDALQTTPLEVIVYQGQLDLICDSKAAMDWVHKMTGWADLEAFKQSSKTTLRDPVTKQPENFFKSYGKFKYYNILQAGHAVPKDQGWAALRMLRRILDNRDT